MKLGIINKTFYKIFLHTKSLVHIRETNGDYSNQMKFLFVLVRDFCEIILKLFFRLL